MDKYIGLTFTSELMTSGYLFIFPFRLTNCHTTIQSSITYFLPLEKPEPLAQAADSFKLTSSRSSTSVIPLRFSSHPKQGLSSPRSIHKIGYLSEMSSALLKADIVTTILPVQQLSFRHYSPHSLTSTNGAIFLVVGPS